MQCLNCEKRSGGTLEARRRDERRRRENRGAEGEGNGEGCPSPQPTRGSGGASWASSAGSGVEPPPKTNLVHFVAARRTLIVSSVMDVETHTAKHEQQKCDHVYIHKPYARAFCQTINLQSAGCGQARGVKPKAERRGRTLAYSVPPRASPEVPVWRSGAFRLRFKHWIYAPNRSASD